MIVCVCNAVSERAIHRAVADGVETFADLQWELGVGTGCGACVPMACAILNANRKPCQSACKTTNGETAVMWRHAAMPA